MLAQSYYREKALPASTAWKEITSQCFYCPNSLISKALGLHLSSLNPLPHSDSKELLELDLSKEKSVSGSCFFLRKEIQPFWRQELPEH